MKLEFAGFLACEALHSAVSARRSYQVLVWHARLLGALKESATAGVDALDTFDENKWIPCRIGRSICNTWSAETSTSGKVTRAL